MYSFSSCEMINILSCIWDWAAVMVNKWSWVIVLNTSLVVFCFAPCCHLHKPSVALLVKRRLFSELASLELFQSLWRTSLWPPHSPCTPALFGLTFPHPPYRYITVHSWSGRDVIEEQLTRQYLVLPHIDSLQSKVFLHSCECAQRPCIVLSVIMRSSQPTELLAKRLLSAMCVWHGYDARGRESIYVIVVLEILCWKAMFWSPAQSTHQNPKFTSAYIRSSQCVWTVRSRNHL